MWTKQEEKAAGNIGHGGQGGQAGHGGQGGQGGQSGLGDPDGQVGHGGQGGHDGQGGQGGHGGKCRRSSLLWAVFSNREDEIDLLLAEKSVDVNAKDHKNNTALHHACLLPDGKGQKMLTKLVGAPGILLNVKNCDGRTPIMLAIARGWTEGVKLLAASDQVHLGSAEYFARYNSPMERQTDIIQVLKEAKQRRREKREWLVACGLRNVREQRRAVSKVLFFIQGIYTYIPHICHGRTDDVRVNFFWPV